MATHEVELTDPVDLCTPDGSRLNPAAIGWSRVPLHTANLRGRRLRTKKWDYWAVLAPDLAFSVTYANVGYLGIADMWWCEPSTGLVGGRPGPRPGGFGMHLPDRPGTAPLRVDGPGVKVSMVDDEGGTTITAEWTEHGEAASLDLRVDLPPGHESVNVVIPWDERTFQYTSKHQARPARGTMRVGDRTWGFGVPAGEERTSPDAAWGVLDVGRGRWPYSTRWNWGGGAGVATDGRTVVGLQFGGRWTEGTGATENGVIVDGRVTKIGDELVWEYDWAHPMRPWRVRHRDGSLDVTLTPAHDRHSKANAVVLATEVHQVFGRWSGHVTDDSGTRYDVEGILGFAEESVSRW
ncbi:MAG: DUF2804 domain-containing protein [Acidimicrobiales bacterium]|nr:DUF2804 domain-containing protein [Acidimicrobiales bacterium]